MAVRDSALFLLSRCLFAALLGGAFVFVRFCGNRLFALIARRRANDGAKFPFCGTIVPNAPLDDDWRSPSGRLFQFGWRRIEFTFAFRGKPSLRFATSTAFLQASESVVFATKKRLRSCRVDAVRRADLTARRFSALIFSLGRLFYNDFADYSNVNVLRDAKEAGRFPTSIRRSRFPEGSFCVDRR